MLPKCGDEVMKRVSPIIKCSMSRWCNKLARMVVHTRALKRPNWTRNETENNEQIET